MAQRVTGFARRPANQRAAERARVNTEPTGDPVPLDLVSVVAEFRRYRGLSIRVERLAHGARLSQGRNNGDRSWSLAPDELEGLEYLPPSTYEAHTLGVRIISLDGGDGETLAVVDLPIAACLGKTEGIDQEEDSGSEAMRAELHRVRDELVKVKSSLAARETELATTRRTADDAERSRQSLKAEFVEAEASWDRELREQLAVAANEAEARMQQARIEWESEHKSRISRSELGTQKILEEARKRWQQDSQAALTKAQAEWKVAEVARMAAAEASWRETSEKKSAELKLRAERAETALAAKNRAPAKGDDAEMRQLREQLTSALNAMSDRDKEFAQARAALDAELYRVREELSAAQSELSARESELNEGRTTADLESSRLREQLANAQSALAAKSAELAEARTAIDLARAEAASSLTKAEQKWKSGEVSKLVAVEKRWKEQLKNASAEARSRIGEAENALSEARAQAEAQAHQLSAAQALLTARDNELAQMRSALEDARARSSTNAEQARDRWQQELQAALAKAQESFKSGEAARLAAAEAKWKAQFANTLAETTTRLEQAEAELAKVREDAQGTAAVNDEEIRRLRDELTTAETALATRENELADLRSTTEQACTTADQSLKSVAAEIEKARQKWKKDTDASFAKAEQKWRAEEAPRLAAAEAQWHQQIAVKFADIQDRLERSEAALLDAQECSEALRHELSAAQASLTHREVELAEARALLEQERERVAHAPITLQERKPSWQVDEEERRARFRRRLVRDLAIVGCLFALAFLLIPRVQPVVANVLPQDLSLRNDLQPLLQMAGLAPPPAPTPVATAPLEAAHATVRVRMANLRESPSTGASVLVKLARDVEVVPVERRGEWVLVRIGEGSEQKQGWVSSSVLKDMPPTVPVGK